MNKQEIVLKSFSLWYLLTLKNDYYKSHVIAHTISEIERDIEPNWDITSELFDDYEISAEIISKDNWILAGCDEISFLCDRMWLKIDWLKSDWDTIWKEIIGTISWNIKTLTISERVLLNLLQRMTWIATKTYFLTNKLRNYLPKNSHPSLICATRKTLYWLLDKKAVAIWWGWTHRLNLSDAILIKDNHIKNLWIEKALEIAWNKKTWKERFFEIECETLKEAVFA